MELLELPLSIDCMPHPKACLVYLCLLHELKLKLLKYKQPTKLSPPPLPKKIKLKNNIIIIINNMSSYVEKTEKATFDQKVHQSPLTSISNINATHNSPCMKQSWSIILPIFQQQREHNSKAKKPPTLGTIYHTHLHIPHKSITNMKKKKSTRKIEPGGTHQWQ